MGLGALVALPWIGPSWLGQLARLILILAALVHIGEAFYARMLAERAKLDPQQWFWRSLVLGYLAIRKLQTYPGAGADTH